MMHRRGEFRAFLIVDHSSPPGDHCRYTAGKKVPSRVEFFDELKQRVEFLHEHPDRDSEATRHDHLVMPILTNEFGLGWPTEDLVPQKYRRIPKETHESHIFRNAETRKGAKPDILISRIGYPNIAVVEEKERQKSLESLGRYNQQLTEYQAMFDCVWGVLTDGENWIIKRNFERYAQFASLDELLNALSDVRALIGRHAVYDRLKIYNTTDLVQVGTFPFPAIVIDHAVTMFRHAQSGTRIFSLARNDQATQPIQQLISAPSEIGIELDSGFLYITTPFETPGKHNIIIAVRQTLELPVSETVRVHLNVIP